MQLTIDELLELKHVIKRKNDESYRVAINGIYEVENGTISGEKTEIISEQTEAEFNEGLSDYKRTNTHLIELEELLHRANDENQVTITYLDKEYTFTIAQAIKFVKAKKKELSIYNRLKDFDKVRIEYTGNSNERQVRRYKHDIDGYKDRVKDIQLDIERISRDISSASKTGTVEVSFAEEYL